MILALLASAVLSAGEPAAAPATTPAPAPGAAATTAPAAGPDVARLLQEADAAYQRRDEPGEMDVVHEKLAAAEKLAPDDYGVLWRMSRYYFWLSDDPWLPNDQKSKLGKEGWDYGDRASARDPSGVEGWYWGVAGMGNYSLGIGVLKALTQGIEGKFKDRMKKAEGIDPGYNHGGVQTAWGRFYYKLPWPKYDAEKSERYLLEALKRNPQSVRARVYLADLYEKEDHGKEARAQLEKAVAPVEKSYDPPEERRYQKLAREMLDRKK
jgi:hypothetical protein